MMISGFYVLSFIIIEKSKCEKYEILQTENNPQIKSSSKQSWRLKPYIYIDIYIYM